MLYTVAVCALGWSPVRCVQRGGMGWAAVLCRSLVNFCVFVYAQTEESCEK